MALFRTSPEKALQRDRDTAEQNRDRLAERLTLAEQAVTDAKGRTQRAALDGDDAGLAVAEAVELAALHHLNTMQTARTSAETLLEEFESQIIKSQDQKTRQATAAETEMLATDFERACDAFNVAISAMEALATKVSQFIFEARGLEAFAASSKVEVPIAATIVASLLREHGHAVLRGDAPPTLPTPQAPLVPTIPAKPETVRLFATRAVSWTDPEGHLRYCQRYNDVDLPPETATRALELKACVPLDDPARRELKGTWPGHPNPAQCFCLDSTPDAQPANAQAQSAVLERAGFVETIGEPYTVRVAAGGGVQ